MSQFRLSASKIKTFCNCSFFYWQNYHNKLPQALHPSLPKGTVIHLILELLLAKSGRKAYVQQILHDKSLNNFPSLIRLIDKHLVKSNLDDGLTFEEVEKCIFIGLSQDFFCEGAIKVTSEFEFSVPLFGEVVLNGLMDKIAIYEDKIVIYDYKSSKQKFSGDELDANTQAMIYLWVAKQLFPDHKDFELKFVFLKFPRTPIQSHRYNDSEINGFMTWVYDIARSAIEFTEEDATSNFAFDRKKDSWLCAMGKTWRCPYKEPFTYWSISNLSTGIVKKQLEKPEENLDCLIEKQEYTGCKRFYP